MCADNWGSVFQAARIASTKALREASAKNSKEASVKA